MNRGLKIGAMLFMAAIRPAVSRADETNPWTWKQLADRGSVVKPTAKELAWLAIPWVLDLKAAQLAAGAEGRPIFLWVTGDDPLERC